MTVQASHNGSSRFGDADSSLRADALLLAHLLEGKRDELAQAMTQRFMRLVADYHTLPAKEEILSHYTAHLDAIAQAPNLPIGQQAAFLRDVAASRGREDARTGVSLATVVEGYRIGLRVLSETVLKEEAQQYSSNEALAAAVSAVWRLQDVWVHSATAAYYKESRESFLSRERQRAAMVDTILDGRTSDTAELWDIAEGLRLPYDSRFVVVVAEFLGSGQQEKFRAVENRLGRAGIAIAWRLSPEQQTMVAGIAAVGGEAGRRILAQTLSESLDYRIGISPLFDGLERAGRALRFAKLAMVSAPRGSGEVTVFDQAPVAVMAASAPDVLAEVSSTVFGSLNQLPNDEREVLVGTLRSWLACGGSTDAAAKALFCHPNTVRYRLNRLTEHTGRSLTDPRAVTELSLALYGDHLGRCA